ncbi:fused MFS/spermidine synthase [Microbaculum marinisediminis]|uniref:Fused MFS/spermidine synthase n=1 Tax=Microbaculum marinisediminis TaxID=2931392 RepID=A0AAW5R1A6_9HYPH|nr:fused MFS/spermidine synthase [Microbaculum sp. A6E488]MCT8972914.1 fused MFS/spermidine synthase [Microbaculum sp. A6E488]
MVTRTAFHYLVVVTVSSACGLAVEITAGRLIAPYLGMSLYTWTAVIAVVLAGFSIGHWIGGHIAEAPQEAVRRRVGWALLLAGLSTAASLVLIRLVSGPIVSAGMTPVPTILALTMALFFLPSVFVGIPSPALVKLAIDENPPRIGRLLGLFYAGGAIGAIAGTLATGYLFISWLGSTRTLLLVAALYLAMGASLLVVRPRTQPAGALTVPLVVVAVLAALIAAGGMRVSAFTGNCDVESDYYCIRTVDVSDEVGTEARLMILDHLGHSISSRDAPQSLLMPYVDAQDMLARIHSGRRTPFRAFFIGGGGFTLPRAWLDARPDAEITVAEIDPAVTAVAIGEMWLRPDERLKIVHQDARQVLSHDRAERYDVIVGDAFHDIAVPPHLVTGEFFALVRSRLADDGIFLMNVVDSSRRPRLVLSIAEALKQSFGRIEIWALQPSGERTTFVIAALEGPSPVDRLPLRSDPAQAFVRLPAEAVADLVAALTPVPLSDDYAPVDRLIGVE